MKRLIALLLAGIMLLGLIPLAFLAIALGARQRRRMEAAFDAPQAGNGAFVGISGENIDLHIN